MSDPIRLPPVSHPADIIALARDSSPPLAEPGYSCWLLTLIEAAESIGADDVTVTDSLVREIIIAYQDAAIDCALEGLR